jgi:hypothetical protein
MPFRSLKLSKVAMYVMLGIPLAYIAVQLAATVYDRHRVQSMCAKLVPGTTLKDVRRIVAAAGVRSLLPPENAEGTLGDYDASERSWFYAIPVTMEMGDERCGIYSDGHVVTKAAMEML